LAGVGYGRWKQIVEQALSTLSEQERAAILGENAIRLYRL
jgi:predicted TIM-barrel fold metal-dependent hydrolase